ncbi:unnamed protein product, partial [Gulo gulo]
RGPVERTEQTGKAGSRKPSEDGAGLRCDGQTELARSGRKGLWGEGSEPLGWETGGRRGPGLCGSPFTPPRAVNSGTATVTTATPFTVKEGIFPLEVHFPP